MKDYKITAKELRIGNIIGWRLGTGEFITGKCYEIQPDIVAISEKPEIHMCQSCERPLEDDEQDGQSFMGIDGVLGVPLTEEWLIKFGLIPKNEIKAYGCTIKCKYVSVGKMYLVKADTDWELMYMSDDSITLENSDTIIKYIHQLQNLYFALTGTELQITDK